MKMKNYSQRKACDLVGIGPRVYRYQSTRGDDTVLCKRLVELSGERRRFGYRFLHILLRREGFEVNWKILYRLYRQEKLAVRKRGGRKRAHGTRAPMAVPQDRSQRWSLDCTTTIGDIYESLQNLTPADVYFGRGQSIIEQRERIKQKSINERRLQYRRKAA